MTSISKTDKIISIIKQSLNGEQLDYTQGSIPRAVVLLAIPMILELSLESVFAVVDMFFVGKLGENAIATVGLTEAVITIVYSVGIGLSTGATAIVARRIGEKDPDAAAYAGAQSMLIALGVTLVITLAGMIFAADILQLMGASAEVVRDGAIFTRIMLGGSLAIILLFLINGIFRGAGDAAMAMRSLWIASLTNIILCPLLIHFFGLKGAAIATVIGRSTGVVYQLYHLLKGDGVVKFHLHHFKYKSETIKAIIDVGWPATIQFIIASGSWIVLTRMVADLGGTDASAGFQISLRNFIFFILPAWGLSNAAATLVGQNLGAMQPERAEKSVMLTAKYNTYFTAMVTLLFLFLAEPIVLVFSNTPAVVEEGVISLQVFGAGYIFYGLAMVMTAALNGAGDTKTPTWINFIGFWIIQIPLAYLMAYGLKMNTVGVYVSATIVQVLVALMTWYYFKKGRWKEVKV